MIMTVTELKQFIDTELADNVLEIKLSAIESAIRAYTNNNFQNRMIRCKSSISDGVISTPSALFGNGDTVEITESPLNKGLFVFKNGALTPTPYDCEENLITKIEYPMDVKMGVVNLLKWDLGNRDKVGVSSETISRHSVTYFNMDGSNSLSGYPVSLMGFLKPYMKARF